MEFRKKMQQRRTVALSYLLLGAVLLVAAFAGKSDNYFFSSYGIALILMGILRLVRYKKIIRNDKTMRKQELAESDERYRMIAGKARSWAFSLSILAAGVLVIVLNLLGYHEEALPFAWFVCGMVAIYWVCWCIINRKYCFFYSISINL